MQFNAGQPRHRKSTRYIISVSRSEREQTSEQVSEHCIALHYAAEEILRNLLVCTRVANMIKNESGSKGHERQARVNAHYN